MRTFNSIMVGSIRVKHMVNIKYFKYFYFILCIVNLFIDLFLLAKPIFLINLLSWIVLEILIWIGHFIRSASTVMLFLITFVTVVFNCTL